MLASCLDPASSVAGIFRNIPVKINNPEEEGSGRYRKHFRRFSVSNTERIRNRMNIYVGNLPYGINRDQLRDIFAAYGEVAAARVVTDRETQRSKGFGFVEMPNDEEAKKAIEALNGNDIGGRKAVVNEARPREERPPREKRW